MLEFDSRTHRYRNSTTGRFVRYGEVLQLGDQEVNRLEVRLQGHARLLIAGKIEIGEFQARMAESLKESHIRLSALGAGGAKNLKSANYGHIGQELKKQYQYLYKFGKAIEQGDLSEQQILSRSRTYAQSANIAFHKSEFTSRGKVGFYGKRLLDPQARHCPECVTYQQRAWTLLYKLMPPGVNCSCGGRCRCRIIFRKI